ncbi:carboxymuconolactone decarboxylase family protein [Morganella morganii]|nr:carboxymuconolactone decarboxylase family protein [Morganella morganii]
MSYYQDIMKEISGNMQELSKDIPAVMKAFSGLVAASTAEGALDKKTKELIMIGIAVANRCDGCIGFHTKTLVELGVTEQELAEALGVAVTMGGGPSVMYAANTIKAFKELS